MGLIFFKVPLDIYPTPPKSWKDYLKDVQQLIVADRYRNTHSAVNISEIILMVLHEKGGLIF